MSTRNTPADGIPGPLPPALADGLRGLPAGIPPARDLWPDIAGRLEPRAPLAATAGDAAPAAHAVPPQARRDWRRHLRRRNAGYAAAAAVVLAAGAAWQMWPAGGLTRPPRPAPDGIVATSAAADAASPLQQAADALAREYQGALREARAATATLSGDGFAADLDADLERSATEVRAALARDPDALHLFQRLHRIYAHRLALSLRQA